MKDYIKKQDPTIGCLLKTIDWNEMGRNIYTTQINNKHRKVGMAILISKKVDFKTKIIISKK